MGLSQAQSVAGTGFIPDAAEAVVLKRQRTMGKTKAKSPGGFYEIVLLLVSLVLLLFGLLPRRPEQLSAVDATGATSSNSTSPDPLSH